MRPRRLFRGENQMFLPEMASVPVNLAAALAHAASGRRVFPCRPNKAPYTTRGFKEASTDQALIRDWWARWPDALIGLPTGAVNGIVVLDIDNHGGVPGDESLEALQQRFEPLPETVEALTAGGGRHLFFRHPRGGVVIPNSSGALGASLDVRGDGGYVIAAPSRLPDGRAYEWEGSSDPDEGVSVAPLPAWLLALLVRDAPSAEPATSDPSPGAEPIGEGARNDTLFRLGRSLRAKGLTELGVLAALRAENAARCQPPLDEGEVDTIARSACMRDGRPLPAGPSPEYRQGRAPSAQAGEHAARPDLRVVGGTAHDERPTIQVRAGELPEAVDQAEAVLIDSGVDIYQHGTRLVRVGQWVMEAAPGGKKKPLHRPHGSGVLIDITPDWMTDALARAARWEKWDARKGELKRVDAPGRVAATLISRVGSWRFPPLVGFCDSPTLDLEGRVVVSAGYDAGSGLYLSHPPSIEPMVTTDRHLAEWGRETLEEAFGTFPFVSAGDRAACLALLLTVLLRRLLPSAPIGAVSASTPGTGKSKLVDAIAAIATGRAAAVVGIGSTPEELEKRVDSVLLKGDTLASFDNVDRPIKSDVLCQVSTQAVKSIRVMGLSKIVEAPTNVALMMTGNNLTLVGDLVRRCVVVNLDAGCERPELREFERDAIEYVIANRQALIRAALAISKSYIDAGAPKVRAPPYGSFETWDRMVRRPLIWCGCADPLAPAEAMRDQDHELVGMRDLLEHWLALFKEPMTAADLTEAIKARQLSIGEGSEPRYPELYSAGVQVMGDAHKWGPRELGYRLRAMSGRLFDGRRIVKTDKSKTGVRWRVESING